MNKVFFLLIFFSINNAFCIENSIMNQMDMMNCLKQKEQFSDRQYAELVEALKSPCRLRLMSYNILSKYYDEMQKEENQWKWRKDRVLSLILNVFPDILCCQELTIDQIADLNENLANEYNCYAPILKDEKYQTELLGIFFRKSRFVVKHFEKIELGSPHFSTEYQSYCYQYFLKVTFQDIKSRQEFVVYNTHADYLSPQVRLGLVDSLLAYAEKDAIQNPVILAGDFNTLPGTLPSVLDHPQAPGFDGPYILQTLTKSCFRDSLHLPLIAHVGPLTTFPYDVKTKETFSKLDSILLHLDHIFVNPNRIKVFFHAIEPAKIDGYFPSDHLPVIVDLALL